MNISVDMSYLGYILVRSNSLIYCFCLFRLSLSEMVESETAHGSTILMKQIMNFAKYSSFVFHMAELRMIQLREKEVI